MSKRPRRNQSPDSCSNERGHLSITARREPLRLKARPAAAVTKRSRLDAIGKTTRTLWRNESFAVRSPPGHGRVTAGV